MPACSDAMLRIAKYCNTQRSPLSLAALCICIRRVRFWRSTIGCQIILPEPNSSRPRMPQVLDASAIEQIVFANGERSLALKMSFLTNQYKADSAQRATLFASALRAPLEAMKTSTPIGISAGRNRTTIDSLSTVAEESVERCSRGLAW